LYANSILAEIGLTLLQPVLKMVEKHSDKYVKFRFYGSLNDFLVHGNRHKSFKRYYFGNPTVKDLIESTGVLHPEVSLILCNGDEVTFGFRPQPFSRIACYPQFHFLPVESLLRIPLARPLKFILDVHLGKLASYLRICGFDTLYSNSFADDEIISISSAQNRVIVTRDKGILRNGKVTYGYFMRSNVPKAQLKELFYEFDMKKDVRPFSRCTYCNGLFEKVTLNDVNSLLKEGTARSYSEFYRCTSCGKVYWIGAHSKNILKIIGEFL